MISATNGLIEPLRTSSNIPPIALGSPAAMPAKIRIEMPLPRPRSVICSPSHIRNIVPVTSDTAAVKRNIRPGSSTSPGCDSSATEMPKAWKAASASVNHRVYCVILRRPDSPSFLIASSCGTTTVSSCMMIDAEMYGMIPSARTENRDSAPPENRLNRPNTPPDCCLNSCVSCSGSMPGTGMCVPIRKTTSARSRKPSRRLRSPYLPPCLISAVGVLAKSTCLQCCVRPVFRRPSRRLPRWQPSRPSSRRCP